ncbi:MAG: hypothetical protein QOD51_315, partial [Candidatus Eremiobacteraeota bacterium]|nr:hypothetical protein [Candidatus Eremiobacteraeota bacterium]
MRRAFVLALGLTFATAAIATGARAAAPPVPAHVLTWYYFGLNGINARVPATVMARYADFAEDDVLNEPAHVIAFKRAGGAFAVSYTDPAYTPYCHPPFAPPAGHCEGPVGRLLDGEESAFFHGRDGTRVRRFMDDHFLYQEAFNPKSAAARRAWRATGDEIVRNAPVVDFFMADDAGGPLHTRDMSPKSGHFYNFNDAGTEITSDAEFRDAWIAYITSAPRPLIVNGYDAGTGLPSFGGAILRARGVLGAMREDCFRSGDGLKTDSGDRWRFESDSLLANTALQRYAVCFMMGTPTPPNRLYALASWWITYDPRWSVAAPIDPIPSQSAILPELDIVPRSPLRTATSQVAALRAGDGTYVREFGACYDAR